MHATGAVKTVGPCTQLSGAQGQCVWELAVCGACCTRPSAYQQY